MVLQIYQGLESQMKGMKKAEKKYIIVSSSITP
jgi:hypothetical protein